MYEKFTQHTRTRTGGVLAAALLAVAPALVACGSNSDAETSSATQTAPNGDTFNQADVTFAQQMIPHHAQAMEMVDMARGRKLSSEVQALADQIMAAQSPEIETMTDWLTAWGEEVPATSRDHANAEGGHDMGDLGTGDMPGMMTTEEMDALASASDAEFEAMWLEMMVEHHEGAIEMAKAEQQAGAYADAIAMAETIETGQSDEVAQMKELVGS